MNNFLTIALWSFDGIAALWILWRAIGCIRRDRASINRQAMLQAKLDVVNHVERGDLWIDKEHKK